MNIKDKIVKLRSMYITQHGREPSTIILGYLNHEKLDRPKIYIGMKVYIDYDKDNRIEVGNLAWGE